MKNTDHSKNTALTVLIDTNIVVDVMLKRLPFFHNSYEVLKSCLDNKVHGYLSNQSIPTIWYLTRRELSDLQCRILMKAIFDYLDIIGFTKQQAIFALDRNDFQDYEDCLQDESALNINADYIITRNIKDYTTAKTPAILPEDFVKIIREAKKME